MGRRGEDDWTPPFLTTSSNLSRPARADGRRIGARVAAHWDRERQRQPPARPAPRLWRPRARAAIWRQGIEVGKRERRGGEARERESSQLPVSLPLGPGAACRPAKTARAGRARAPRSSACGWSACPPSLFRGARPKARSLQAKRGRDNTSLLWGGGRRHQNVTAPAGGRNSARVERLRQRGELREREWGGVKTACLGGRPQGGRRLLFRAEEGDVFDPLSTSRSGGGEHVVPARARARHLQSRPIGSNPTAARAAPAIAPVAPLARPPGAPRSRQFRRGRGKEVSSTAAAGRQGGGGARETSRRASRPAAGVCVWGFSPCLPL